jgi:truncated hemoglobin YjbI
MKKKLLPENAHRVAQIISLSASNDIRKPIQFWQLYSVLGRTRVIGIVNKFYERVYDDEKWFSSVFSRIGPINHHVNTQSAMWLDVMGGGFAYHGGEYRLNFHHKHNAYELMNSDGAERWLKLMRLTLDSSEQYMTEDPRVRRSINTFLSHFMTNYAVEFGFDTDGLFGDTNPPLRRKVNFLNMTSDAIEALTEEELREALIGRGVKGIEGDDKVALVNKALSL